MKKHILFLGSSLIAILFMISPWLLKIDIFNRAVSNFLYILEYQEYKSAYIGALGGMVGAFLAITGAILVEKISAEDDKKRESEKVAMIVYYDIKLFYRDMAILASQMAGIMGIPNKEEGQKRFVIKIRTKYLTKIESSRNFVCEEFSERLGRIPCGRTDFWGYRRLFYRHLDQLLRKK